MTAKKCRKKTWCKCKVVVLQIKPIAFFDVLAAVALVLAKAPYSHFDLSQRNAYLLWNFMISQILDFIYIEWFWFLFLVAWHCENHIVNLAGHKGLTVSVVSLNRREIIKWDKKNVHSQGKHMSFQNERVGKDWMYVLPKRLWLQGDSDYGEVKLRHWSFTCRLSRIVIHCPFFPNWSSFGRTSARGQKPM